MTEFAALLAIFATISLTIFVAELTDKDALLLLALATKTKPWTVFAAGSTAFTITSAIIVTVGYLLLQVVDVRYIKIAGGVIMIGYALWQYFRKGDEEEEIEKNENRVLSTGLTPKAKNGNRPDQPVQKRKARTAWSVFLGAVLMLALLDLAGDATEVLTIVFVAQVKNILLVFLACVIALVAASGVETALGNRIGKLLSVKRIKILSVIIFLVIGSLAIISGVLPSILPSII